MPGDFAGSPLLLDGRVLRDMAKAQNSKVIFMPMETSTMLSSIGAIKEVFAETGEKSQPLPNVPNTPNRRELNK